MKWYVFILFAVILLIGSCTRNKDNQETDATGEMATVLL